ncbi:extracellular catalytic domain type 1 short-chain-length polyhydroxyalkanoate depolymerase [Oceanobacillus damuensis]|uniref:extracellular catalytic domain type 1 short-chain-length polyhydroxyalkanoate depolymerase n=1 Tax=Oceanobacillus damuensis TaxID=937928 RepID=UPI000B005177|nr:PHB depolymerase family esterase [Oceanobacillus damuensis]
MLKAKRAWFIGLCLLLVCSMIVWPTTTNAAGEVISGSYGGKSYNLYIPSQYDQSQTYPLYVMLHGCTQDAGQFAAGTKMNELAEEKGFLVLYPEQNSSSNSSKCWNWFETSHQSRGSGEPAVIAGMVQSLDSTYSINNDQVFVAGLSAGAAMSVILGATYPDIFSGIGVGAGLEYKAATSVSEAYTAMSSGGPDPEQQGRVAYQAMGSQADVLPVIVFHGTSDYTVNSINGHQVISQWAVTNDLAATGSVDGWIDDEPDHTENYQVPSGKSYTESDYTGQDDQVWMKKILIQDMGHAWSGGSSQGSYTDPGGPDASLMMWNFFQTFSSGEEDRDPDPDVPVTIANPSGGTYYDSVRVELITDEPATTYYTTDGTDPDTDSAVYEESINITENTILKFFSQNSEGSMEAVRQEEYIIRTDQSSEETILTSNGNEDGYAGRFTADGKSNETIKVGDKGMYNEDTYRGILSFDTSTLTEPLQYAKLRLYTKSTQGIVSSLQLDIKQGVFGSSSMIEQVDYSDMATKSNIVSFNPAEGEYIDVEIPASSFSHINQNGITQFRLKAETPGMFDSNFIEFYGGETVSYAPKLIIGQQ